MKNTIVTFAAAHALGTTLYVVFVATFLTYASEIFGTGPDDTILIPIAMLMLFVVSAAVTGSLVLARPILWYLDGKKKEAISLLVTTIGMLFLFTIIAFCMLAVRAA